jgi:hypothetical protein
MLSPGVLRVIILWRSSAATGRGWRHPTFTGRRPAPGRRARWLEIQASRCDRFLASRQQWRRAGDRRKAHGHPRLRCLTFGSTPCGSRRAQRDANRRRRGCRKATLWAGNRPHYGCRVGIRVPVAPRRHCRRGWRRRSQALRPARSFKNPSDAPFRCTPDGRRAPADNARRCGHRRPA